MSLTHVTTLSQLNGILSKSNDKLSVIDFHASWCSPCHAIAPTFEALSKKYTNVNFLKCDVDAARDVASQYSVSAMPTFVFLKGTTKVDQVRGADKNGIERALEKHSSGGSPAAFSGKGHTLAGSSSAPKRDIAAAAAIPSFTNLDPQVKTLLFLVGAYVLFWYLS
ncbi:thioredoxin [Heterobasidion irregulare TC 32-1]|uniref:Thioredoxin n=1 Tax=Heterobasidion irregulare (strain TC 32-1) TaxID=747525 RepID=W4KM88_HETIT|nr:thioredoxin [Heterobasidion irregulare TC 32-1]ETW86958.1 thioredoxin [Heterobasidion irregulare TC 32-1]